MAVKWVHEIYNCNGVEESGLVSAAAGSSQQVTYVAARQQAAVGGVSIVGVDFGFYGVMCVSVVLCRK